MIIEFTVGNFLSFKKKRTLKFKASGISELPNNVFKVGSYKLIKSGVIYGANSSGKSNLIKAIDRMRDVVLNSVRLNDNEELDFSPFLLSNTEEEPTYFEVDFLIGMKKYRYGFEYNLNEIISEWLFIKEGRKEEIPYFIRTEEGIGVSEVFEEGIDKEKATNNNRLFISLVAQLGGEISKSILEWFKSYNVISGIDHKDYTGFTLKMLHQKIDGCQQSQELYQRLQLGFKGVDIAEKEFDASSVPTSLPDSLRKKLEGKTVVTINTIHNKYDDLGNIIGSHPFEKENQESEGTKKVIDLSGPIFDTLLSGRMLIIDELDAKLHPLITTQLIKLFNNTETNPNNAQLFFATHDTNLLSSKLFRRDQIWFAEKDEVEQTDIYSMSNITLPDGSKVRNDSNLERNYIRGRYGAIPFLTY
ncbi:MAG: ATP-binding protein [Marinifilaceae bacterium]|jgi:AAA15 family ATPase/GTPase|nr:ATP-binding protein [Marinifilaceae bacterium]